MILKSAHRLNNAAFIFRRSEPEIIAVGRAWRVPRHLERKEYPHAEFGGVLSGGDARFHLPVQIREIARTERAVGIVARPEPFRRLRKIKRPGRNFPQFSLHRHFIHASHVHPVVCRTYARYRRKINIAYGDLHRYFHRLERRTGAFEIKNGEMPPRLHPGGIHFQPYERRLASADTQHAVHR